MKVNWQSSPRTAFHGFSFEDIDQDGDLDLIGADYGHGGSVSVYRNDGGKLPETPTWSIKTSGPTHETVFADIDNDGDLDMAVGCKDQAHIYENLSAGRSKSPKQSR